MRVIVGIWDDEGKLLGEQPFEVEKERSCLTVFEIATWIAYRFI
jgi:hypothetical protein